MAFHLVAEALLRIEHKVDALLRHFKVPTTQMHFIGSACPVCMNLIEYQLDMKNNVAIRKCNCRSGKQPSLFPITDIGEGNEGDEGKRGEDRTRDGDRRGKGRSGSR
jgi:hypothetical protein